MPRFQQKDQSRPIDGDAFRDRIDLQNSMSMERFTQAVEEAERICSSPLGRATKALKNPDLLVTKILQIEDVELSESAQMRCVTNEARKRTTLSTKR